MNGFTCRICGRLKPDDLKMAEIPVDNHDKVCICSACIKAIIMGISNYTKQTKSRKKKDE